MPMPMRMAMSMPMMTLRTAMSTTMAIRTAMSSSRSFAGACQHSLMIQEFLKYGIKRKKRKSR